MKEYMLITDDQWNKLKSLFPVPVKRGRGKPHTSWRSVLNSILFVLLCNAKWGSWPNTIDFASKSAAHRWYLTWEKNGNLEKILSLVHEINPEVELYSPPRRERSIQEGKIIEEIEEHDLIDMTDLFIGQNQTETGRTQHKL